MYVFWFFNMNWFIFSVLSFVRTLYNATTIEFFKERADALRQFLVRRHKKRFWEYFKVTVSFLSANLTAI
jgi:hypothetical protein